MRLLYNKTALALMGIIPERVEDSPNALKIGFPPGDLLKHMKFIRQDRYPFLPLGPDRSYGSDIHYSLGRGDDIPHPLKGMRS